MKKDKNKNQSGMITVETVLAFIPFVFVVLGIILFADIFMVHNRIQHAMYQSASQLSGYTYVYQTTGLRAKDSQLQQQTKETTAKVNETMDQFAVFMENVGQTYDAGMNAYEEGKQAVGQVQGTWDAFKNGDYEGVINGAESSVDSITGLPDTITGVADQAQATLKQGELVYNLGMELMQDPKALLESLGYMLLEEGKGWLLGAMMSGLMDNYLATDTRTADQYLENIGVVDGMQGLRFNDSQLFADDNNSYIDVRVEYDLKIPFWSNVLGDEGTITMAQRVVVPAWLDGDGRTADK